MIPTLNEFASIPEPERSNLLYLRGVRDQLGRSLSAECFGLEENIERMIQCQYGTSAYHRLNSYFQGNREYRSLEALEVFRKLCLRVARLERERAGAYVEAEFQYA